MSGRLRRWWRSLLRRGQAPSFDDHLRDALEAGERVSLSARGIEAALASGRFVPSNNEE